MPEPPRNRIYGCDVVFEDPTPDNIVADIVFVHGLTGRCDSTWTSDEAGRQTCWPKDLLPKAVGGGFRAIFFGYDADIASFKDATGQNDLSQHADDFVMDLTSLRRRTETTERPIIFVGHSMGGLLIKMALLSSESKPGPHADMVRSACGVVFLATPHCGANLVSWAKVISHLLKLSKIIRPGDKVLKQLEKKSDILKHTEEFFLRLLERRKESAVAEWGSRRIEIMNFYEQCPTPIVGKVVDDDSAMMKGYHNQSIHADHRGIARFADYNSYGFRAVSNTIWEWLAEIRKSQKIAGPQRPMTLLSTGPGGGPPSTLSGTTLEVASTLGGSTYADSTNEGPQDTNAWFDEAADKYQTMRFIGRQKYLNSIHSALVNFPTSPRTVVLQGLGGQGKTALAIQYAHLYHQQIYKLVFWVDASSPSTTLLHFSRIARERDLMKGVIGPSEKQLVDRFLRYLKRPEAECLILFDNFDVLEPEEHAKIAQTLPKKGDRVSIIITSRNFGTSVYGTSIHVNGMEKAEALELLFARAKIGAQDLAEEQKEACEKIIDDVGCLPLAVEQAAAYILTRRLDPRAFLKETRENRWSVMRYIPENSTYNKLVPAQEGQGAKEVYVNAFATWELSLISVGGASYGHAETAMSPVARLLSLSAFLDRTQLPSFLFKSASESPSPSKTRQWLHKACVTQAGWDSGRFRSLVIPLANLSLVEFHDSDNPDEYEFSMHPLVQEWARLRLTESERLSFFQAGIWLMADFLQPDNFDSEQTKVKGLILKHLDSLLRFDDMLYKPTNQVSLGRRDLIPVTLRFASFYLDHGIYNQTRILYQKIIDRNAGTRRKEDRLFVVEATEGVAIVEMMEGNFDKAQKYCEKALEGYESLLGRQSQPRLRALHNLGEIHGAQGNFDKVLPLFREALEGCEATLGPDHILTLREVEAYGNAHRVKRLYSEASTLYHRALEGMKRKFTEDIDYEEHPDLLGVTEGLAIVQKGQGDLDAAETNYRIALEGNERSLGENHPDTLNVVEGLGDMYALKQDTKKALELYTRTRDSRTMIVGPEHPDTVRVMKKMGELFFPRGEIDFQHDTAYYPWYRAITDEGEESATNQSGWSRLFGSIASVFGMMERTSISK